MVKALPENKGNQYSLHSHFPCTVILQGKNYKECCCKLEAKDTWFALVHLLGFPKSDVQILNPLNGEEVIL